MGQPKKHTPASLAKWLTADTLANIKKFNAIQKKFDALLPLADYITDADLMFALKVAKSQTADRFGQLIKNMKKELKQEIMSNLKQKAVASNPKVKGRTWKELLIELLQK